MRSFLKILGICIMWGGLIYLFEVVATQRFVVGAVVGFIGWLIYDSNK